MINSRDGKFMFCEKDFGGWIFSSKFFSPQALQYGVKYEKKKVSKLIYDKINKKGWLVPLAMYIENI
jgi:hypothetical protein